MKLTKLITALLFHVPVFSGNANAQRNIQTLEKGWKFFKGEASGAEKSDYNDSKWENVTVPHDWLYSVRSTETMTCRMWPLLRTSRHRLL